jgi:acyl-coenzyme A thioesterase PaaI-like protein
LNPPAVTPDEIQALLRTSPFMSGYGFALDALGDGFCSLLLPYDARHDRPGGVVTGIVLVAAADLSMWFAIMTRVGAAAAARSVTIELKTSFLRGARGDVLTKARWLDDDGGHAIHGVADAYDGSGALVAHHTLSYVDPR